MLKEVHRNEYLSRMQVFKEEREMTEDNMSLKEPLR